MSQHHFDTEIAQRVGIAAATIYENIRFWCARAEANDRNGHEGHYWVFNSISAWEKLFPYLTEKQIRGSLEKLLEAGLILKGCFNKDLRDRTLWYAIAPMHLPSRENEHLPSGENADAPEGKPLPDNNLPDNNPDRKQEREARNVFEFYNEVAAAHGLVVHAKLTDDFRKHINARLGEHGMERVKQFIVEIAKQPWATKGFDRKPEFRASLTYILRPRTFTEHFDRLVTTQPPPDLLTAASAPIQDDKLDLFFSVFAQGQGWRGRSHGFLSAPDDPDADYPEALYVKHGLKKPERV